MVSTSYFTTTINGLLYPKAARAGDYAFAHEVWREGSKVRTKYLGIQRVQNGGVVVKKQSDVVQRYVRGKDKGFAIGYTKVDAYRCCRCHTIIGKESLFEHRKMCRLYAKSSRKRRVCPRLERLDPPKKTLRELTAEVLDDAEEIIDG